MLAGRERSLRSSVVRGKRDLQLKKEETEVSQQMLNSG